MQTPRARCASAFAGCCRAASRSARSSGSMAVVSVTLSAARWRRLSRHTPPPASASANNSTPHRPSRTLIFCAFVLKEGFLSSPRLADDEDLVSGHIHSLLNGPNGPADFHALHLGQVAQAEARDVLIFRAVTPAAAHPAGLHLTSRGHPDARADAVPVAPGSHQLHGQP